jgi:transposase
VQSVPKREIARRLQLDVKTVRRAVARTSPPERVSPPRGRALDRHHDEIAAWMRGEPRLTSKRVAVLLFERHGVAVPERTVREYVADVRREVRPREAFVHRTHAPGDTIEVDFGDSLAVIAGRMERVKFVVATLPTSNAHFARAYPFERMECLFDAMLGAFTHFGGLTRRAVLDNTSLAVKEVLRGRERRETEGFLAFRGALSLAIDFCAPAKGNEKGSVEGGVNYVRNNGFRPMPVAASFEALSAQIMRTLDADQDRRRLADGRTVREALAEEREHLRPLPAHLPEPCRVMPVVADKYGHVRVDHAAYSVPIEHAWRPALVKLFAAKVVIIVEGAVVAEHVRALHRGQSVLDALHVLPLLVSKHRAVGEATAILQWELPPVFHELRAALAERVRKPDQEWAEVLLLSRECDLSVLGRAVEEAIKRGSPRLATVKEILRKDGAPAAGVVPVEITRPDLRDLTVALPMLGAYDVLGEVA